MKEESSESDDSGLDKEMKEASEAYGGPMENWQAECKCTRDTARHDCQCAARKWNCECRCDPCDIWKKRCECQCAEQV